MILLSLAFNQARNKTKVNNRIKHDYVNFSLCGGGKMITIFSAFAMVEFYEKNHLIFLKP